MFVFLVQLLDKLHLLHGGFVFDNHCFGDFAFIVQHLIDKLNRITASKFGTANSFRTSYLYDWNGNLSKLTRRGSTGAYIDSISYGYKYYTNQLDYTEDYNGDAPGWDFPGTLTGSNHYQYDANGNLTRDDCKAVSVSYNSFNLPLELDFGNNQKLSYYYDGSGRKITKINTPGTYYPTNTEYRGQLVHQSSNGVSSLKYIITPEGRLKNTGFSGRTPRQYFDECEPYSDYFSE